jgi:hypothetical protein
MLIEVSIVASVAPYSTCILCIVDYEHVVFIDASFDFIPYINDLESLIYRLKEQHYVYSNCSSEDFIQKAFISRRLKKIDFICSIQTLFLKEQTLFYLFVQR